MVALNALLTRGRSQNSNCPNIVNVVTQTYDVYGSFELTYDSLLLWSAVDDGHVPLVVALAGRRREVV